MNRDTTTEDVGAGSLICPHCHGQLRTREASLVCQSCHKEYPMANGIPNFCEKDEYWCNVSREKMRELNARAQESGDWAGAVQELIPEYLNAKDPFSRADSQFLWPTTSQSRILDAGCMWGALTIPVAQYCGEIFAVDKTLETLTLLKIRAGQMGLNNVHVMASPLRKLPFPDGHFDMVVLNGVLEWVALDQDLVLEVHWGKKRTDTVAYAKSPREAQLEVLRELRRVLKPGGHLSLAIENRFGYQYIAGQPDDHVNIRYVPLLPRPVANAITKWKLNCEYRTYVYSLAGYRSLLTESGFHEEQYYGAFFHYTHPSEIIPLNLVKHWKNRVLPIGSRTAPRYLRLLARLFPSALLKHVSPSFILVAGKAGEQKESEARVVQLLGKAGLFRDIEQSDIRAVKYRGRLGTYHAANFLIYDKDEARPTYFCKICRSTKHTEILENEARNLETVNRLLMGTELAPTVPRLLYFGTIDKVTLLATQFIEGDPSGFNPGVGFTRKNLEKLDKSIQLGIGFLAKFQKLTRVREVEAASFLLPLIEEQKETLANRGRLTREVESRIVELASGIAALEGVSIPICAVHGDYHCYNNILFWGNEVRTVDFEHFEPEGRPFLDLASLIFNPILLSYKNSRGSVSLSSFIDKNKLRDYIVHKWLAQYAEISGISRDVIRFAVQLAALEQQTKEYPYYRDPQTYPMYPEKAFVELLSLRWN